jgi:hypothetical protein
MNAQRWKLAEKQHNKLDIADGIVACKFNKPCEVEIKKRKTIRFIIFVNGFRYTVAILLNAGLI